MKSGDFTEYSISAAFKQGLLELATMKLSCSKKIDLAGFYVLFILEALGKGKLESKKSHEANKQLLIAGTIMIMDFAKQRLEYLFQQLKTKTICTPTQTTLAK